MKPYTLIKIIGPINDPYPNNFKCWVMLKDNITGEVIKRRGYGKFIGNFAPIWVTINNVKSQLTQICENVY